MTGRAAMIALVREHRLDDLPRASKDSLAVQAAAFARTLRNYSQALQRAWEEADPDIKSPEREAQAYDITAQLYAPGLIAALAAALLESDTA